MAIRKERNGKPKIAQVSPTAAIAGGDLQIRGEALSVKERARVTIGEVAAPVIIGSNTFMIVRVPDGASGGDLVIENNGTASSPYTCEIGIQITDGVHPVANPAVDRDGNIVTTFSGSRGQKTQVSVYKIDLNYHVRPFLSDVMNATGVVFDREGMMYVSSRYDGIVYQVTPSGNMSVYVEGMGVSTGLAFDGDENLYVGDRSGTIFKISRSRQIYVFTTSEPSIAAYHLAFGPDGNLYVTGPTTSSFDAVQRVAPTGEVDIFYRGLGRPQGLAFDANGNLYVAASLAGRRGVVRVDKDQKAELFLSGPNVVGLAFTPSRSMVVATNGALYRVDVGVQGLSLF
jgi:sugar lactone lactonase YvrE